MYVKGKGNKSHVMGPGWELIQKNGGRVQVNLSV